MSEQTRYRFTGAVFLIALAAILAPMLFDGDGLPKIEVKGLEPASSRQPVQAPSGAFGQQAFDELEQKTAALRDGIDSQGFSESDGASFGEVGLIEPQAKDELASPTIMGATAPSTPPPANAAGNGPGTTFDPNSDPSSGQDPTPASQLARVWAIQVASFARGSNAQALRDELRSQGYEGFLSSVKRDGEVWTRVVVGPFLNKSEAQRVMGAIAEKFAVSPELRMVAQ